MHILKYLIFSESYIAIKYDKSYVWTATGLVCTTHGVDKIVLQICRDEVFDFSLVL